MGVQGGALVYLGVFGLEVLGFRESRLGSFGGTMISGSDHRILEL